MDNFFTHFGMTKSQRSGFFIFLAVVVLLLFAQWYITTIYQPNQVSLTAEDYKKIKELKKELQVQPNPSVVNNSISPFNPNILDKEAFLELGFSPKQTQTIINFRTSIKGFKTKEDFHKSYGVSDIKFKELKPFILLPDNIEKAKFNTPYKRRESQKQTTNKAKWKPKRFDVNTAGLSDWVETGLSVNQAEGILNYRKSIGGSFKNKKQLKKAYTLPDYIYTTIEPYLVFPSQKRIQFKKTDEKANPLEGVKTIYINKANKSQLIESNIPLDIAEAIIDCRDYNGRLKNIEDLKNCPDLASFNFNKIHDIQIIFN